MKRKRLKEELRYYYARNDHAEAVPADRYDLDAVVVMDADEMVDGGYVIEVATKMAPSRKAFIYEPLRHPLTRSIAFWSDRQNVLDYLAEALYEL